MRISHLTIENFRSIKKLDVDLPQIAALVGPNNAGKSNILTALNLVLGRTYVSVTSFGEADVYRRAPELDVKISVTLDPPAQYRKFKLADPVDIPVLSFEFTRYVKGDRAGDRRFEQKCMKIDGKPVFIPQQAPKKGQQTEFEPLIGIPSEVRDRIPLIYLGTNRELKDHLPGARYSLLRILLEDVDRDLRASAEKTSQFSSHMQKVMEVLRTDQFQELEASIKKSALRQLGLDLIKDSASLDLFFSPFSTMDFYKSLDLIVKEHGFEISATELGEGMQNALVLAILQAFEERRKKGAIILLEEPEMFLHPQMQRSLYKTLREIGKTNQIIYATHSPHFVTVPEYNEVMLVRKDDEGTTVRLSDLLSTEKRKEKFIKELDPERNEMFFASRILFVEGDTEKLALPEYARRLKLDLDRAGATIVEVGGKRNLKEFAEIAASFVIPVGIVYDTDSSDFKDNRKEEMEFNRLLDSLAKNDGSFRVWHFDKKYEDHLRKTIGEGQYQCLCQKYSGYSKAIRARLIAVEVSSGIPDPIPEILRWLADAEEK